MKIFDFSVNTFEANEQDFNNAVDFLRYIDCKCGYNQSGFDVDEIPMSFAEKPLSAEEFKKFIVSVCIFIEKCNEYFPPQNNFIFPYRGFDMKDGIKRYFDVYILLSFLKNQNTLMFYSKGTETQVQKNLNAFINTSQFIRAFVMLYDPILHFSGKYTDFGMNLFEESFDYDLFPFKKCIFKYNGKKTFFICSEYIINDGNIYKLEKTLYDEKDIGLYFTGENTEKTKYYDVVSSIMLNYDILKEKNESLEHLRKEKIRIKNERRALKKRIYKIYNDFDRSADKKMNNPLYANFFYNLALKKLNKSISPLKEEMKNMAKQLDRLTHEIHIVEKEICKLSSIEEWMELILQNNEILSYVKI